MMGLITDSSIVNGWFALLGVLGVLMLGIGNIVLFAPPVAPAVQPARPAPVFRRSDLWN